MKKRRMTLVLAVLLVLMGTVLVSADTIPDERLLPRLVDEAELLTEEEESELLASLDEISERQQCDVAVAAVNSLEGKTATAYADDFFDYNGYGYGKERDGILLLISMQDRDRAISTHGYGITAFTDAALEYMADEILFYLSDDMYIEAFEEYAALCDDFITQAKTGEPYDVDNLSKGTLSPFWIFADLLIGLLIALIVALFKKGSLKSVWAVRDAHNYEVPGSLNLKIKKDRFIRSDVRVREIECDTNHLSGGSSTHVSSSGETHGGSSGKF